MPVQLAQHSTNIKVSVCFSVMEAHLVFNVKSLFQVLQRRSELSSLSIVTSKVIVGDSLSLVVVLTEALCLLEED